MGKAIHSEFSSGPPTTPESFSLSGTFCARTELKMGRSCESKGKHCSQRHRVRLLRQTTTNPAKTSQKKLRIARGGIRPRTPLRILIFCCGRKAKRIALRPVGCRRPLPRSKLSKTSRPQDKKNSPAPPTSHKTSRKVRKRQPAHIIVKVNSTEDRNDFSVSSSSAAPLNGRKRALETSPHPKTPLGNPPQKKRKVSWAHQSRGHVVAPSQPPEPSTGPCTRNRSAGTQGRSDSVPINALTCRRRANISTPCGSRAGEGKAVQACTPRRSARKRPRRETDFSNDCSGPASLPGEELQNTPRSGRKKRRTMQCSVKQRHPKEVSATHRTQLPLSNDPNDGKAPINVGQQRPKATPRRPGPRRRRRAKRRGKQRLSQRKNKEVPPTTVPAKPVTASPPEPTKPSSLRHRPEDQRRPSFQPAVTIEPADFSLAFNSIMEWPCIPVYTYADSPDWRSEADDQPRFWLCGGLPDPLESPPWLKKATPHEDEECRGSLSRCPSVDRCAQAPQVTMGPRGADECREESPRGQCVPDCAPATLADQVATSGNDQPAERSERGDRSHSRLASGGTTALEFTPEILDESPDEEEDDDWTFTVPAPDAAQAILDRMGNTIRRILATTHAAQRRSELFCRVFDRLLPIDYHGLLPWQEKNAENAAVYTRAD